MGSFWKHVNKVLREADIIIEVLDARMVEETRNPEIEQKIRWSGKKILYVINKCDLVENRKFIKLYPSIYISSKDKLGTTKLKKKILEMSKGEKVTVGVLGYPNVGKSSVINALSGRGAARTSTESNFTKGVQKIRVGPKILLLDTPGVFPKEEKENVNYGKMGAISYGKIKDPEVAALGLIEEKKENVCNFYHVTGIDADDVLENIGMKFKKLSKGGKVDLEITARMVLKDWQVGKIR